MNPFPAQQVSSPCPNTALSRISEESSLADPGAHTPSRQSPTDHYSPGSSSSKQFPDAVAFANAFKRTAAVLDSNVTHRRKRFCSLSRRSSDTGASLARRVTESAEGAAIQGRRDSSEPLPALSRRSESPSPFQLSHPAWSPTPTPTPTSALVDPFPKTTQQIVPPSTQQGALISLQPGKFLSATAIELAIKAVILDNMLLLDPLWYRLDDDLPEKMPHISNAINRIILPLHWRDRSHWTVTLWDIGEAKIYYYDSCAKSLSSSHETKLQELAARCVRYDSNCRWRVEYVLKMPVQRNGFDCGVYITAVSIVWLAESFILTKPDCGSWRLILHALISGQKAEVTTIQSEQFSSPALPNNLASPPRYTESTPETLDAMDTRIQSLVKTFAFNQQRLSDAEVASQSFDILSAQSSQAENELRADCEANNANLAKLSSLVEISQTLPSSILASTIRDGIEASQDDLLTSLAKTETALAIQIEKSERLRYVTRITSMMRKQRRQEAEQAGIQLKGAMTRLREREKRARDLADFAEGVLNDGIMCRDDGHLF